MAMKGDWFGRLIEAIHDDGRSYRAISQAASLGPNYIQQMIKDGKRPGVDQFMKIVSALGSAPSLYVLTGARFTAEDEMFFRALAAVPPEKKHLALEIVQALREPVSDQ